MALPGRRTEFNPHFGFLRFLRAQTKKAKAFFVQPIQTVIVKSFAFGLCDLEKACPDKSERSSGYA